MVISIFFLTSCEKGNKNPIKFPYGIFPDTIINLSDINTVYDDYNTSIYQIKNYIQLVFSSNRKSQGGQFDLEQAEIAFVFDQTTGILDMDCEMSNDQLLSKLITSANTPRNDFGPYRFYSTVDGYDYLVVSSLNSSGNLDLYYLKNLPVYSSLPDVIGPKTIKLLNSDYDDAYLCFDQSFDSAYFTSNRHSNFDIYLNKRPAEMNLDKWFDLSFTESAKVDSINSNADDKCPFIYKNIMVFASDREGGYGGYDLYYSVFRNGKWNSPVNMGPEINTTNNEYRPVVGTISYFANEFMIFSSDRPGGKGSNNFDLYFTGIDFSGK